MLVSDNTDNHDVRQCEARSTDTLVQSNKKQENPLANEIIISSTGRETRIALLEHGQLAELHIDRGNNKSYVGNIYLGKVVRVLPGMQAAFVEIGLERAAFLCW